MEREKQHHEEFLTKSADERSSLGRNLHRLEEDNVELQRQLQALQAQLAQAETDHTQKYGMPLVVIYYWANRYVSTCML